MDTKIIPLLSEGSILLYKVAFTNEKVQTSKVKCYELKCTKSS